MDARSTVLILSSDEAIRDTLRWCLAEVVDHVVLAISWTSVVPLVKEHQPQLVVLDFDAIEPAGRPLLAQLLRTRYRLPIVAVGTTSAIVQAEQLGIPIGVAKPLDVGRIMATVADLVGIGSDP